MVMAFPGHWQTSLPRLLPHLVVEYRHPTTMGCGRKTFLKKIERPRKFFNRKQFRLTRPAVCFLTTRFASLFYQKISIGL
jgi:hypothetical protein